MKHDDDLTRRAEPRLLDLKGAEKYLGVKARTLRDRVNGVPARTVTQKYEVTENDTVTQKYRKYHRAAIPKEIPFVRVGRRLYFDRQDLDEWIQSHKERPVVNERLIRRIK